MGRAMALRSGAGSLNQKVAFEVRVEGNPDAPRDLGNRRLGWVEQFVCYAAFQHLTGGEAVIAARLQGRHMQIIRVRASSRTRRISADWRARDARRGTTFNIRDVVESVDRQWIDLLCEAGVAT